MLPSTYRPTELNQFIGPAQAQAAFIQRLTTMAMQRGDPLKVLILGAPGIGKSSLAEWFVRCTGAGKWSVSKFNGTAFRIDDVEDLKRRFQLTDMFEGYRVVRLEEIDKVPNVAQVSMLTLLDDLPARTAFVGTSNCRLKDLEERFQRRFTVIELQPPKAEDIHNLIRVNWPTIPEQAVRQISQFSCGNVGQALQDADAAMAA